MLDRPPTPAEAEALLVQALEGLGGAGERNRIIRAATNLGEFSDPVRRMQSGKRSRLENDFGHALSRLSRKGVADTDGSGWWTLSRG